MPMKFGFFLMPAHHPAQNPTLIYERDLRTIEYAESLGYDEFWIGEHHTGGWEIIPAPDVFISAAAQRTKRIRLGTGVVNLPYHHPFHVAERMAMLDHLTYGRVTLGVGPGALPPDIKMFGVEPAKMRPMMDESLDIILKLFRTDGPVTYEGQYWTLKDMELQVKSYQQPHVPVAVASTGRQHSLELAATYGLQVLSANFQVGASGEAMGKQWAMLESLSKQKGTVPSRPDWRIANYVYVADTREKAIEDIEKGATEELREYFFPLGVKPSYEDYPGQPASEIDLAQAIRKRGWIIGNPDDCIQQLQEMYKGTGGFGGLLITAVEWTSWSNWDHSLELFARYVAPEFQHSNRGMVRSWNQLKEDAAAGRLPTPYGPQKRSDQ
ncbi:MAG: LLM class flavin-dependent oxidoreductase [Chloroflexi bacterium]|nr:LLM class flavin-dependent oxidoreductase [Chloroflexota bacterium]